MFPCCVLPGSIDVVAEEDGQRLNIGCGSVACYMLLYEMFVLVKQPIALPKMQLLRCYIS